MKGTPFLIMSQFKKLRDDESGLTTVELSLTLPVLLFVVLMAIIFMLTIYSKIIVVDSAREAARVEALGSGVAVDKAEEVINGGNLKAGNLKSVEVSQDANQVTVEVEYNQPSIIPGLPRLIGGSSWGDSFKIKSKSVFKKERY